MDTVCYEQAKLTPTAFLVGSQGVQLVIAHVFDRKLVSLNTDRLSDTGYSDPYCNEISTMCVVHDQFPNTFAMMSSKAFPYLNRKATNRLFSTEEMYS